MNPAFIKQDWLIPLLDDMEIKILCANQITSTPIKNTQIFVPQQVTTAKKFNEMVIKQNISRTHFIIIYDVDGVSAPLLWFQFVYYGHPLNNLSIIKNGYSLWNGPLGHIINPLPGSHSSYQAIQQYDLRLNYKTLVEFCRQLNDSYVTKKITEKHPIPFDTKPRFQQIIDCRHNPKNVFPGAVNISYQTFIQNNITIPNTKIFQDMGVNMENGAIFLGDDLSQCAITVFNAYLSCGEIEKIQVYFESIEEIMDYFYPVFISQLNKEPTSEGEVDDDNQ